MRPSLVRRTWSFGVRAVIAGAILWAVISVPLPLPPDDTLVLLRIPAAVFLFVIYVGKTLYDTFFYQRYP